MALPLLPIALALTAGGIGANYMGARKADRAQADTMAAERIRQRGYDQQADAKNVEARDRFEEFEPDRDERAEDLTDLFLADAGSAPDVLRPAGDPVTVQRTADEASKRRDYTDQQGAARANLL